MFRTLRKAMAVSSGAALALIAPTVVPAAIGSAASAVSLGCGLTQNPFLTFGSANAYYGAPCAGAPSAMAPSYVMFGAGGAMTDAAYVGNAQCGVLTPDDALASTVSPAIGWLFNGSASPCKR